MHVRLALLNYGMGNLHSVRKALEQVGAQVCDVASGAAWGAVDGVVLPGVGHFGDGMRELHARGLVAPLTAWVAADRPLLGICLGQQLLMECSEEAPDVAGLGICRGRVVRFQPQDAALKVPHMGWNTFDARPACPLCRGIAPASQVYFVHSYHVVPDDPACIGATTTYGVPFCSLLWRGNLFASQFHPEKSQAVGLAMLRNFVEVVWNCSRP
jgi:glutamine amidotransferase